MHKKCKQSCGGNLVKVEYQPPTLIIRECDKCGRTVVQKKRQPNLSIYKGKFTIGQIKIILTALTIAKDYDSRLLFDEINNNLNNQLNKQQIKTKTVPDKIKRKAFGKHINDIEPPEFY